jgi:DNA (cytosine-5)-methyltransferase 1
MSAMRSPAFGARRRRYRGLSDSWDSARRIPSLEVVGVLGAMPRNGWAVAVLKASWTRRPSLLLQSMTKPRLLDLFCGAGGAAMGYARAGFEVVGVDIKPQPHFPFEFVQADVLDLTDNPEEGGVGIWRGASWYLLGDFDAIHASPPCQAFTQMSARWRGQGTKADEHQDLLTPTLALLRNLDVEPDPKRRMPWVVENVVGARKMMNANLTLHGGMFGLGVHRPRLFESNVLLLAPRAAQTKNPLGVYGKVDGRTTYRYRNAGNYKPGEPGSASKSLIRAWKSIEEGQEAMRIDWMTEERELAEAIPPAYTELIGHQLLQHIQAKERVA